jgi:hypothetical protein
MDKRVETALPFFRRIPSMPPRENIATMSHSLNRAIVTFSIDLSDATGHGQQAMMQHARTLAELFATHHFPATWAASHPAANPAVDLVLKLGRQADFALLGDSTWVGRTAGRTRFAHELQARLKAAQTRGLRVSTLAMREGELDGNLDLLVRERISVVRSGESSHRRLQNLWQPQSLRFGVWHVGVTMRLPDPRWWFGTEILVAKRALDRVISNAGLAHFVLDAGTIAGGGQAGIRAIERLVRFAALRCEQQRLTAKSLPQLATTMLRLYQAPVGYSVLRAAA